VEVIRMRIVLSALGLAAVLLIAHSFRGVPAIAQAPGGDWVPFTAGQTLRLTVDLPGGVVNCKVTQVLNGFIGCARDDQRRQSTDQWINLRNVQTITPSER
jgi:hypothetical protein